MKGFNGIISSLPCTNDTIKATYSQILNCYIKSESILKFEEDKVFFEDNELFVCLDGYVLNKKELINKYAVKSMFDLIKKMYKKNGNKFVDEMRGSFIGIIINKSNNEYLIFDDHLGTKFLYYYYDKEKNVLIFGTDMKEIIFLMKTIGIGAAISYEGAYFLLTYGYMIEDVTLIENIKKLKWGSFIEYNLISLKCTNYYRINNNNANNHGIEKVIKNLNELFRTSIELHFDKDEEYNYSHYVQISGGLDTRAILFYALDCGYKDVTMLNFAEIGSGDMKIAFEISKKTGVPIVFESLNTGSFLMNPEEVVSKNNGNAIYIGGASGVSMNKKLSFDDYGMLFNGCAADLMHGDYMIKPYHVKPIGTTWMHSNLLQERITSIVKKYLKNYENDELFVMYNRGINGMFNGVVVSQNYSETAEPFLFKELIDYSNSIKPEFRFREYAFIKMLNKYMNPSVDFKWDRYNVKPKDFNINFIYSKFGNILFKIMNKINKKINNRLTMNPYEKWYSTNKSLNIFINDYFENNKYKLQKDLLKDCISLYSNGNFIEKSLVITLIAAINYLDIN